MKERIQMRGHCQMCGRLHAANPQIAKHGYTVEFGWFQGVCPGADYDPLEQSRVKLDELVVNLRNWAADADIEALALEDRETNPEGKRCSYRENGKRVVKVVPYETLLPYEQEDCRRLAVSALRNKSTHMRQAANDMLELAAKVHGQPLVENKVGDQGKVISVGDTVKVCGDEVVVTKLAYATARGIGYRINGQHIEHVFWNDNGKEYSYPKRYARKVVANG